MDGLGLVFWFLFLAALFDWVAIFVFFFFLCVILRWWWCRVWALVLRPFGVLWGTKGPICFAFLWSPLRIEDLCVCSFRLWICCCCLFVCFLFVVCLFVFVFIFFFSCLTLKLWGLTFWSLSQGMGWVMGGLGLVFWFL